MSWARWLVVVLASAEASFMVFDGARALLVGDYITPRTGKYAGRLGPWEKIVRALGADPRSVGVKAMFVIYGAVWAGVIVAFAMRASWSWMAILVMAVGSLWYLVIGTALSVTVLVLLFLPGVRGSFG